jgi:hypothetical protein
VLEGERRGGKFSVFFKEVLQLKEQGREHGLSLLSLSEKWK